MLNDHDLKEVGETAQPALTAEQVLWRSQARALASILGRKKAEAFLRAMAEDMAGQVAFAEVTPIRGDREAIAARRAAVCGAARVFNAELPALISAMCR